MDAGKTDVSNTVHSVVGKSRKEGRALWIETDRLEYLVPNTTSLITNREQKELEFGCKVKGYYR